MKKTLMILASILISAVVMAQGPLKVSAKFNKGEYVIYESESNEKVSQAIGGTGAPQTVKLLGEVKYEVVDARPDGYTIECTTTKLENAEAQEENPLSELSSLMTKMLIGKKVVFKTDADGKIIKLENFEELKKGLETTINETFDKILKSDDNSSAEAKAVMENIKSSLSSELTEEKVLETLSNTSTGQFNLYGKTITTGTMEDNVFNSIKFKTTYMVPPSKDANTYTVKSSSVGNMTEDDMVKMIIDQVEKIMPDQAEMMKQNIDMLKQSGMLKIDANSQSSYEFLKNGWNKSGETTLKINMMGSNTETNLKWKIKESNLK